MLMRGTLTGLSKPAELLRATTLPRRGWWPASASFLVVLAMLRLLALLGGTAGGIHAGAMIPGKMEGDAPDMNISYLLQQGEADGPHHQTREVMAETTPIILGGVNALCLPAFFLRNWATPT